MRKPPKLAVNVGRAIAFAALAIVLATTPNSAQSVPFQQSDEGQLFGVRSELHAPGLPSGVTFIDGTLYRGDADNGTVIVFDHENPEEETTLLDGESTDEDSPFFGLVPNMLSSATVRKVVGGIPTDITALLVSDSSMSRVFAVTLEGEHLFTMWLDWDAGQEDNGNQIGVINGMAMAPGGFFEFTPASQTLTVQGTFAASWAFNFGGAPGALLVYTASESTFLYDGEMFEGTPAHELTSNGTAKEVFDVAFDSDGNVYAMDTLEGILTVYGPAPDFTQQFTLGEEGQFSEAYGLSFWPDAGGGPGRLFIADALDNRIEAYEPDLNNHELDLLFTIEGFTIDQFDSAQPFALAIDPAQGRLRIATSDSSGNPNNRTWILQTRNLVAYDLETLDVNGTPVGSVCAGQNYQLQFKLTVPVGWDGLSAVRALLTIDGAQPIEAPDGPIDLGEGEAYLFRYQLTAPTAVGDGDLDVIAGGTLSGDPAPVVDVLPRRGTVSVASCTGELPTVTPSVNIQPQLSGWTPVFLDQQTLIVTLTGDDPDGDIVEMQYEVFGTNDEGDPMVSTTENPVPVPLSEDEESWVIFRARDNHGNWSAEPDADGNWPAEAVHRVNIVFVEHKRHAEGQQVVPFRVGPPPTGDVTYSTGTLPPGVTFNQSTAEFGGTLAFDAAGTHPVTITETSVANSSLTSQFSFNWIVSNVPLAANDNFSTNEDTTLAVPAPGVLANDTDGSANTASLVDGALHGSVTLNTDGSFAYTPAADFNGPDSFTYRASDGTAVSNVATVTITVNPVNDAPSFTPGPNQTTTEDAGPQTVPGWATAISAGPSNESDQSLTFEIVSNSNAALFAAGPSISPNGPLIYTSAANAHGSATVTIRLRDGGGTNPGQDTSAPQSFTITVAPVNDAPTAVADNYTVAAGGVLTVPAPGVLGNDTDVEGPPLQAQLVSGPSSGVLALNPDGSFVYTPLTTFSGTATFQYAASDGFVLSAPATVTIVVASSNQPPVCSAATVTPSVIWPPNHRQVYLTINGVHDPDGGKVLIFFTGILQDEPTNTDGDGNTDQDGGIEFLGLKAWVRAERSGQGDGRVYLVSFKAVDKTGKTCTGEVRVGVPHSHGRPAVLSPPRWNSITGEHVSGLVNPNAVDDKAAVAANKKVTIAVLDNDTPYGQKVKVSIARKPGKGEAVVNANGTITYSAPKSASGSTTFTYRLTGSSGGSDTAVVTITFKKSSNDHDDDRDDDDCGDRDHDHKRDHDNRDRDHKRGNHDRCRHRR